MKIFRKYSDYKKINFLNEFLDMFDFKTICDSDGNEFVTYKSSPIDELEEIEDKTAFEAVENHIHILDNTSLFCKEELISLGNKIGQMMIKNLNLYDNSKRFIVFVTVNKEDLIVRFHQRWEGEPVYFTDETDYLDTTVLRFEN